MIDPNTLFTNDNLFILCGMNSESVDLIYLDPPFNSKRIYKAPIGAKKISATFADIWTWDDVNKEYLEKLAGAHPLLAKFILSLATSGDKAMASYLTYMTQRVIEMHRVLKETGSFYLHCDPTASHYIKIMLDDIFGKKNFRNEIIWAYTMLGGSEKQFPRKHDVIFFYSKNFEKHFFSPQFVPYKKSNKSSGVYKSKFFDEEQLEKLDELDKRGKPVEDYWTIPIINSQSKERTGYPTQKPLALLHRIIKASSGEEGIVLDPFCGCATTCVASQQLGRKWIGIDIEPNAPQILLERLSDDAKIFKDFTHRKDIPHRTDVEILLITPTTKKQIKDELYKNQEKKCNGCYIEFEVINLEIDYIVPRANGGGDYMENYQLLCGACNRIKGDRPMEYLTRKIKRRVEILEEKITFGED